MGNGRKLAGASVMADSPVKSKLSALGESQTDDDAFIPDLLFQSQQEIIFHEAQFFPLQTQSNIYGLLSIRVRGLNKLVVATLGGEIFCLEYHKLSVHRPPSLTPITFNYIPADAEVISIDACVREPNGIIVGVTLIKNSEPKEVFFNLYGVKCDPEAPFSWDKVAEDWQPLSLKFTPFQLCHTKILVDGSWESVFLLPGDDRSVHLYRESRLAENDGKARDQLVFQEEGLEELFPELLDLPSSVTNMTLKVVDEQRITALGCQAGYCKCSLTDLSTNTVLKSWETRMIDGPITSVKLFTLHSTENHSGLGGYHLLVCSAIELGVVFSNVLERGFDHSQILPSSHAHDSVLCATVGDVTWDGNNELVLGTYGKKLLVYKHSVDQSSLPCFKLVWQRSFAHPLHCLWYGDITHDGLSELVVLSMGGVHILQHDLHQASSIISQRLSTIKHLPNNELQTTHRSQY